MHCIAIEHAPSPTLACLWLALDLTQRRLDTDSYTVTVYSESRGLALDSDLALIHARIRGHEDRQRWCKVFLPSTTPPFSPISRRSGSQVQVGLTSAVNHLT